MKIYVASCLHHNAMWQHLKKVWAPEVEIVSSWLDHAFTNDGESSLPQALLEKRWAANDAEIKDSAGLIAYAQTNDLLRGTLVELGLALAYKKPILIVGHSHSFGTWQFHPRIHRCKSLDEAKNLLVLWKNGYARSDFEPGPYPFPLG